MREFYSIKWKYLGRQKDQKEVLGLNILLSV